MKWLVGLAAALLVACVYEPVLLKRQATFNGDEPPIARCVNLGNALEAPREGEWNYEIEEEHFTIVADAGFDTVRIPIAWSNHADPHAPYPIDDDFFARVDEVIAQGLAANLTVIINVHHFHGLMRTPDQFEPMLDVLWAQIAERYADYPDRLVFEIINEPHGKMTTERVDLMNERLVEQIRQTNPDRWIIVTGADWGNIDHLLKSSPPADDRLIATFHYYDPFNFTHQGAHWIKNPPKRGREWGSQSERRDLEQAIARAAAFGEAQGLPLFLGEFGVFGEVPVDQRAAWTKAVRQEAEAAGISWCVWDFAASFPIYDRNHGEWLSPLDDALFGRD